MKYVKMKVYSGALSGLFPSTFLSNRPLLSVFHWDKWDVRMKPDRLGNQRGVQRTAACGISHIYIFFHFTIHFQRNPAMYCGKKKINGGTEGGSQGQDDTENIEVFIIWLPASSRILREFPKVLLRSHIRHMSGFYVLQSNLRFKKCAPGANWELQRFCLREYAFIEEGLWRRWATKITGSLADRLIDGRASEESTAVGTSL